MEPNPSIDFGILNETDVREEIIAPLLRLLGYRTGTKNNIIRELSLKYPQQSMGRKKPEKDPPIRGKADYIVEVDSRIRWVIEAKDPNSTITDDEIEQAFTYAFHPEIRAVYFALCNGRELRIYATNSVPGSAPMAVFRYEQFLGEPELIANVLGPEALRRDFPHVVADLGKPLFAGSRSSASIVGGNIRYTSNTLGSAPLSELITTITGGSVQRDGASMLARIVTISPYRSLQELNEKLGLATFDLTCDDEFISSDAAKPNKFTGMWSLAIPAGEEMLDLATWKRVKLPITMSCESTAVATGSLSGRTFSGTFDSIMKFQPVPAVVRLKGNFSAVFV